MKREGAVGRGRPSHPPARPPAPLLSLLLISHLAEQGVPDLDTQAIVQQAAQQLAVVLQGGEGVFLFVGKGEKRGKGGGGGGGVSGMEKKREGSERRCWTPRAAASAPFLFSTRRRRHGPPPVSVLPVSNPRSLLTHLGKVPQRVVLIPAAGAGREGRGRGGGGRPDGAEGGGLCGAGRGGRHGVAVWPVCLCACMSRSPPRGWGGVRGGGGGGGEGVSEGQCSNVGLCFFRSLTPHTQGGGGGGCKTLHHPFLSHTHTHAGPPLATHGLTRETERQRERDAQGGRGQQGESDSPCWRL